MNSNRPAQAYRAQSATPLAPQRMPYIRGVFQAPNGAKKQARLLTIVPLVLLFCVVVLWAASLSRIDPANITDYGLVSALPPAFFAVLGFLTISFCLLVHQPQAPKAVVVLHIVVLIVIIHGTLALVYEMPRYPWTYKHIAVVSYIQRHGGVDPSVDIYHNWPGFFALAALFNEIAGIEGAISYAAWAQVFFNLLYLFPLLLTYKASTNDQRLIWLGAWFFYLANWVAQDYFAPQALGYFFCLVVLGVCLKWFKLATVPSKSTIRRWLPVAPFASLLHIILARSAASEVLCVTPPPKQRVALLAMVMLIFSVVVYTHQLSPLVTILCVAALVVFQRCTARSLPILMIILTMTWIAYVATASVHDYAPRIIQSLLRLSENIDFSLYDVEAASPGRAFVALIARGLTAALWGLALLGGVRRLRQGYWDLSLALLAIAPLPLLTQRYGGEILLRVYMFSLPFTAFFAAALLYPSARSRLPRRTPFITMVISGALLASLLFAYYGNERAHRVTRDEIDAVDYLYRTAPPGSRILAINLNFPKLDGYGGYAHDYVAYWPEFRGRPLGASDIDDIAEVMADNRYRANYLLISRGQKEHASLYGKLPPGGLEDLESALVQSQCCSILFANSDAKIFVVDNDKNGAGQ